MAHSELYASTELETWEAPAPVSPAQDGICEPHGFRRLDPEYYAWLRHRMEAAQKAHRAGRLPEALFGAWRERFNALHAWAMRRYGEPVLLAAVQALDPKQYRPPQVEEARSTPDSLAVSGSAAASAPAEYRYPAEGAWRFTRRIIPEAVAQVDAIREPALALGWTEAGLYQNRSQFRFPIGHEYGLVCFVGGRSRLGAVTRQAIAILAPTGSVARLYNHAVPQPWIRPAAPASPEKEPAR